MTDDPDDLPNTTTALTPIDGYDDRDDENSSRGAKYLKFDGATPTKWFLREDGSPANLGPYLAVDCWEEILKWVDKMVAARYRKEPGVPLPDIAKLDAGCPKSEWAEDFNGVLRGPHRHTFNVGLVDPQNGSRCIVSNSTTGMRIAYDELKDAVHFMRNLRGERVIPVVDLSLKQMKTKFGLKTRPYFQIIEWRTFGAPVALPTGTQPLLPGASVAKPTPAEIVDDEIPDHPAPAPKKGKAKKDFARPASMPQDPSDPLPF